MKQILFITIAVILWGCNSNEMSERQYLSADNVQADDELDGAMAITRRPEALEMNQPKIKKPDKIIKEAKIKFEIKNYKTSKRRIDSLVNKWSGYIEKEDEQHSNRLISNSITIRVLSSEFENLLNAIGETSKRIDYKTVNTIDVTKRYIDIKSRLKTKKEVEKRYYEILRKATKIEEILKVENEIRKIREEIEAKESSLKYLDDRISYSTIILEVYQKLEYKYSPPRDSSFFSKFYKALDKGWKGLLTFVIALVHIWPIILIIAIGIFFYLKKQKKNND